MTNRMSSLRLKGTPSSSTKLSSPSLKDGVVGAMTMAVAVAVASCGPNDTSDLFCDGTDCNTVNSTEGNGGRGGEGGTSEVGGSGGTTTTETGGGGAGGEPCMPPVGPVVGVPPTYAVLSGDTTYLSQHGGGAAIEDGKTVIDGTQTGPIDALNKDGDWFLIVGHPAAGKLSVEFPEGDVKPECYVGVLPANCNNPANITCLEAVLPSYCGIEGTVALAPVSDGKWEVDVDSNNHIFVACEMVEVQKP